MFTQSVFWITVSPEAKSPAMAKAMGKGAETRSPGANVAWIAEQLQAGKMVVANGDYYAMADHNRAKIGQGGHFRLLVHLQRIEE